MAERLVEAVLESLDVRGFFQVVTTACEVNAGKPAPDIYLYVAETIRRETGGLHGI